MTEIELTKDPKTLTLTVTAQLDATVERAWQLWSDPRQLERWWGPPTYPATVVDHDLVPGGKVTYYMTGPEGDRPHGWWEIVAVDPPERLELRDGFADEHGVPNLDLPVTTMVMTLTPRDSGTTMVIESRYSSLEEMEQVVAMGMEEGIRAAIGQIDAILAEAARLT